MTSRVRSTAIALALAAWLAGCGPGVGGTGTGHEAQLLSAFDAEPALVCESDLAAGLDCGGTSTPGAPGIEDGTRRLRLRAANVFVVGPTAPPPATLSVQLEANHVEITWACTGLAFRGEWGVSPANEHRYFGLYRIGTSEEEKPAALEVVLRDKNLVVTLRGKDGAVLLEPTALTPTTSGGESSQACAGSAGDFRQPGVDQEFTSPALGSKGVFKADRITAP